MHDRLLPIDIQCAAQAIDTLSFFSDLGSRSAGPGESGGPLDHHPHAGARGLLLLPGSWLDQDTHADVSLGPGHDIQGAGASHGQIGQSLPAIDCGPCRGPKELGHSS